MKDDESTAIAEAYHQAQVVALVLGEKHIPKGGFEGTSPLLETPAYRYQDSSISIDLEVKLKPDRKNFRWQDLSSVRIRWQHNNETSLTRSENYLNHNPTKKGYGWESRLSELYRDALLISEGKPNLLVRKPRM